MSDRDNLGNTLTEAQPSYFAKSKVRNENGEKILYDIDPIKKVEDAVKSAVTTTNNIIFQDNTKSQGKILCAILGDKGTRRQGYGSLVSLLVPCVNVSSPPY